MKLRNCFGLLTGLLISFAPPLASAQEWDDTEFAKLNKSVCQEPDETWRTIPWKTDLLEAQRTAVAESKPIFIWAMDGHPLGCT